MKRLSGDVTSRFIVGLDGDVARRTHDELGPQAGCCPSTGRRLDVQILHTQMYVAQGRPKVSETFRFIFTLLCVAAGA